MNKNRKNRKPFGVVDMSAPKPADEYTPEEIQAAAPDVIESVEPTPDEAARATEPTSETPKAKTPKAPKRLTEAEISERYPTKLVVAGSLRMETEGKHKGKQTLEAQLECGHVERIATSDMFQVTRCYACKHPVKPAKVKAEPKPKAKREPKVKADATESEPAAYADTKRIDAETRALALHSA